VASLGIQSTWGLAVVEDLEAHYDAAAELCRALLKRWEQTEDRHYAVAPLRWATGFFAVRGAGQDARACTDALTRIAAASGTPDALAALAHALGELALLDGDAGRAASHFLQALEHLRVLEVPFERAQTQLRLGVALVATGEREAAVDRLTDAYLTARRLRARPLAAAAARELAALGESVTRRLGRRDAGQLRHGGLSGREVEVVRLVAVGRTNREIAQELFLSPRTVDMHVRNILAKLDCRSRAEATRKAGELGLLENPTG
jgi:DNA-binding NarL/FixJ family response regulator